MNGKIYIGKDLTDTITYLGSPKPGPVAMNSTHEDRRDFTIRKQIIWESEFATDEEVNRKDVELIQEHRANNPAVGYNRWPRIRPERA